MDGDKRNAWDGVCMTLDIAAIDAERQALYDNSQQLRVRHEADEMKVKAEIAAGMTIAERLMRKVQVTRFETVFKDDLGDFPIETRQMTADERSRAMLLMQQLAKSDSGDDADMYGKTIKAFGKFAAELCVTPGVEEYLLSDDVSDDVVIALVMNTLTRSMGLVREAILSFRGQ